MLSTSLFSPKGGTLGAWITHHTPPRALVPGDASRSGKIVRLQRVSDLQEVPQSAVESF